MAGTIARKIQHRMSIAFTAEVNGGDAKSVFRGVKLDSMWGYYAGCEHFCKVNE